MERGGRAQHTIRILGLEWGCPVSILHLYVLGLLLNLIIVLRIELVVRGEVRVFVAVGLYDHGFCDRLAALFGGFAGVAIEMGLLRTGARL